MLAIPRSVADQLALVNAQHGHSGVASTLIPNAIAISLALNSLDPREYALSFGCWRRKRSRSQRMTVGRAGRLEIDLPKIGVTWLAGNVYVFWQ